MRIILWGLVSACVALENADGLFDPNASPFAKHNLPKPRLHEEDDGTTSIYLFESKHFTPTEQHRIDAEFKKAFGKFSNEYNMDLHSSFMEQFETNAVAFKHSQAFHGYKTVPEQTVCDVGSPSPISLRPQPVSVGSRFPGGILGRILNTDLSNMVMKLAEKAAGPAAASGGMGGIIAMQAIMMGAMMLQTIVASAIHIIPPLIPPPVWNNQPLFCLPMLTGHNCFGAVFHLITTTDFITADSTDAMLDGYIASFPQTFQDKVGPAAPWLYKACFMAYMSMHCASIFPMCTSVQTGNDPTTKAAQRVPMCFIYCISTLVACPGFWIEDIIGQCEDVSVPPMCSTAFFWNVNLLPPQYVSFEGSLPAVQDCPSTEMDIDIGSEYAKDAGAGAGSSIAQAAAESAGASSSSTVRLPVA